ncbi:MAG TPA: acyl-CoA dehydrogenase family protein, partial [Bryobacteraceae bacterium]|nr:acyl-CoA dehydrogenase family protein [Bryobacteraceae bacterium]
MDADTFQQVLETISRFVKERLAPNEERVETEGRIPPEIITEMKAIGLFGLTIPEAYGGLGLGMEEEARVIFEIGRTSGAFRSAFATTIGIGTQGIIMEGTDTQKQRYLPRLASGEIISSFALTEPGSGSDAASIRTSATRQGDHYVLNGAKRFITNAPTAGLFTVFARTDPDDKGANG